VKALDDLKHILVRPASNFTQPSYKEVKVRVCKVKEATLKGYGNEKKISLN
jgi:hypothetical protein